MLPKAKESISVNLPSWLVEIIDQYREEQIQEVTRAAFVCEAIQQYFLSKCLNTPAFWKQFYQSMKDSGQLINNNE